MPLSPCWELPMSRIKGGNQNAPVPLTFPGTNCTINEDGPWSFLGILAHSIR